jgi:hypothetical protein
MAECGVTVRLVMIPDEQSVLDQVLAGVVANKFVEQRCHL